MWVIEIDQLNCEFLPKLFQLLLKIFLKTLLIVDLIRAQNKKFEIPKYKHGSMHTFFLIIILN